MRTRLVGSLLFFPTAAWLGCSSSTAGSANAASHEVVDAGDPDVHAGVDPHILNPGPVSCDQPTEASHCSDQNPLSWSHGIARFNPALVPAGVLPELRLALRHDWLVYPTENVIGGRLHTYESIQLTAADVAAGSIAFKLDMCSLGTAMWSEENGPFNIVGILDFNGNNDIDDATNQKTSETRADADPGEPAGMVQFNLSCHTGSHCLDLRLECIDGTSCTTITPVASCAKTTPSCPSDDTFCK